MRAVANVISNQSWARRASTSPALCVVVVALAACLAAIRADGRDDCCEGPGRTSPSGDCSEIFHSGYYRNGPVDRRGDTTMNLNLAKGFGPGDFPPLATTPVESSSPLVPGRYPPDLASRFPSRPTLNGAVDLITGVPTLREIDFELPFGSATFRHVRTYSPGFIEHSNWRRSASEPYTFARWRGTMWDWQGAGWMMSENPIFLYDAAYHWQLGLPKRCYLIIDAYTSIPFE